MLSRHQVATEIRRPKMLWIRIHWIRIRIRIRIQHFKWIRIHVTVFFAFNVVTFGHFMEGNSVTPPPMDMKQCRYLNFDKSHPLILNYLIKSLKSLFHITITSLSLLIFVYVFSQFFSIRPRLCTNCLFDDLIFDILIRYFSFIWKLYPSFELYNIHCLFMSGGGDFVRRNYKTVKLK